MRISCSVPVLVALLIATGLGRAQGPAQLGGHWEGTVQIPGTELAIEIDLVKNQQGDLDGTISMPDQKLRGLPLQKITLQGSSVSFQARSDQPFSGRLAADGQSISGDLSFQGYSIPFDLTRTGDAQIERAPKIPSVSRELEGTWEGSLEIESNRLTLVLKVSNRPDGTASAFVTNLDEGGLQIPITSLTQSGRSLNFQLSAVSGTYSASFNDAATELTGTYKQEALIAPLTFHRAAAKQ